MTAPTATESPAGIEERLVTALAPALPIAEAVVAEPIDHTPSVPAEAVAVGATFVGARSADLVLVIADGSLLTDAAGTEGGRVTAATCCARRSRRRPRRSASASSPSPARCRLRLRSPKPDAPGTSCAPEAVSSAGSA